MNPFSRSAGRRLLLKTSLWLGLSLAATAAGQPNLLWISCEDISPHLRCFGDPHAITPHLDTLAKEGTRYPNTFTTAGVCAPCRSGIITGMYQTSLGTHHMRCKAALPPHVRPFPAYLREAGYFCTNNAKQDYQFNTPVDVWNLSSGKAHWRDRPDPDQPFFSVFNFGGCHESGIANTAKYEKVTRELLPEQHQDPNALPLPPYYPDTPVVREDWKRNYELITAMDAWAGRLIEQLKEDGLYENTIIFFWSDHGVGLPRAKRWLYDSGTRVPLIVRVPSALRETVPQEPGGIDRQLVSSIDLAPTVLKFAGLTLPPHLQGRAFLGTDLAPLREYVYGARDRMDERYDIIRSVRDRRYRYLRNYEPQKPYYQYMNTPEKGATMKEIRRMQAAGRATGAVALFTASRKPPEELYDLVNDPHETRNLAASPEMLPHLRRLREAHERWIEDTRDLGLLPESEIARLAQREESPYEILRQPESLALLRRLREVARMAADPLAHLSVLATALEDEVPSIRYWAATGLGNLAIEGGTLPPSSTQTLRTRLQDPIPAVRVAAARALCQGETSATEALNVLTKALEDPVQWVRLQAAIALDELDARAFRAIPQLQGCLEKQPNKYITRVANRALNEMLGTSRQVP